jgi:ribosomal protein S18 acetylase RimI-like enzyme
LEQTPSPHDDERPEGACSMRRARDEDLVSIVRMLADDPLGKKREDFREPLPPSYLSAFRAIDDDPNQCLAVCCEGSSVVGVLQITFLPYLTYRGGWRALIEGVRISSEIRSRGIGRFMMDWAIAQARARGCHVVQLTTDKARPDAFRFYVSLGFEASHEGMKLHLTRA